MRSRDVCLAASLAALTCSCGEAGVYYDVKFAPGFAPGPTTVSVLGVYQDGRMSNETWNELDARLAPVLGQPSCEAIWGEDFRRSNPDLFEQIDRTSQAEGVTEDMLDRFSEAALGDAIMVISLHVRRVAESGAQGDATGAGSRNPYSATGPLPGSRGARGGPPPRPGAIRPDRWQGQEIRLAATLFSAKSHQPMGRIVLTYLGTNIDDATRRFVKKIGESLPGSMCKGWKVDRVR